MQVTFDYSKLRGAIKEKYGTESKFANALGISQVSMSNKLNNKVGFTTKEMIKIIDLLEKDDNYIKDYFFCKAT